MTFSIVARQGSAYGVAVASKFLAVGAVVPRAVNGVGAVASQSFARVAYLDELIDRMRSGSDASDALFAATALDDGRAGRQLGVVGRDSAATFTGEECMAWAGGVARDEGESGYAIQGNILTGPEVVEAMETAWLASTQESLARRLVAVLTAGDDAGGDSRGRQSAALLVVKDGAGYAGLDDVAADLRVDDHPDPVAELGRLLDLNDLYLTASTEEEKVVIDDALRAELEERAQAAGRRDFRSWVGAENYEMRVAEDFSWLDQRVLSIIREEQA